MKIYYALEELPKKYQEKFENGINPDNTQNFYPVDNQYWFSLISVICLGIPGAAIVFLGVFTLVQKTLISENSPLQNADTKAWLIFILLSLFALGGLGLVSNYVIKLVKWFLEHLEIRNIKKQKGLVHFGLLLGEDLVYRSSLKEQIILIPKNDIVKAEKQTAPGAKKRIQVNHIIYYDEDEGKEYFVEIGNGALDPSYTENKKVYQLVNNWKGIV